MMRKVGAYEAKTHLSELLEDVEKGEDITITRYGRPVARLLPAGESSQQKLQDTIEDLKEFREGRSLGDLNVEQLLREGRA
jgi:prevent-host-death family protein